MKKSGLNSRSEQDVRASGFAWVAREPQLICGAEGARILTEINRLTQRDFSLNGEYRSPLPTLVTALPVLEATRPGQSHHACPAVPIDIDGPRP